MSDKNPVSSAVKRLSQAVDSLEKSVEMRLEREASLGDAEAEVQRMGADRARLAESLDDAQERSQQLEHVNKEVSRRLVDAMESIRNIVERQKQVGS
jgi:F0F1-type ATP synthase membrane subunit b/b'